MIKIVYITKKDDPLDAYIRNELLDHIAPDWKGKDLFAIHQSPSINGIDVFFLSPSKKDIKYQDYWTSERIKQLYTFLTDKIDRKIGNDYKLIFATHWGGKEHQDAKTICENKYKELSSEIKKKIRLTYYSATHDSDSINDISKMVKIIKERSKEPEHNNIIRYIYSIKETLLKNFTPLLFGCKLSSDNTVQISNVIAQLSGISEKEEAQYDTYFESIKRSAAELNILAIALQDSEDSEKAKCFNDISVKIQELRDHLEKYMDQVLKNSNKETIYG